MTGFGFDEVDVQVAVIAGTVSLITTVVSAPLRHVFDRLMLRYKLYMEYQYEQRKLFQGLVGKYHGRMLWACVRLDHRLWNLRSNHGEGWLSANGDYSHIGEHYYLDSTCSRFISAQALIRQFENEAVLVDGRIALPGDYTFDAYAKAIFWAATDVALFDGLKYDRGDPTDHFFSDDLRTMCDIVIRHKSVGSKEAFAKVVQTHRDEFLGLLQFFDGLTRDEERLRWDRLVVVHLLVMAFVSQFGYTTHAATWRQFVEVARGVRHETVLVNLRDWLPRLGLFRRRGTIRLRLAISIVVRERARAAKRAADLAPSPGQS